MFFHLKVVNLLANCYVLLPINTYPPRQMAHTHHGSTPTPDAALDESLPAQSPLSLDLPDLNISPASVPPPPETGTSKAVEVVTVFHEHLVLPAVPRINGRVSTAMLRFVQGILNHHHRTCLMANNSWECTN